MFCDSCWLDTDSNPKDVGERIPEYSQTQSLLLNLLSSLSLYSSSGGSQEWSQCIWSLIQTYSKSSRYMILDISLLPHRITVSFFSSGSLTEPPDSPLWTLMPLLHSHSNLHQSPFAGCKAGESVNVVKILQLRTVYIFTTDTPHTWVVFHRWSALHMNRNAPPLSGQA